MYTLYIIEFFILYIDENKMNISKDRVQDLLSSVHVNDPISSKDYLDWLQLEWEEGSILDEEVLELLDSVFFLLYPKQERILYNDQTTWLYHLFSYATVELLSLCWSSSRIEWTSQTLLLISRQSCDRVDELESIVSLHTNSCYNNKVLVEWIQSNKIIWLQRGLQRRFGTLDKPIKSSHNSDKLIMAFVMFYEVIEHRKLSQENDLLRILHLLIQYYLYFPVYWTDQQKIPLIEKKKTLINLVFISGHLSFVEYTIKFLIAQEQHAAEEEKRKVNYHFLEWSSYSRDKELYRKAKIYPISSTFEHSCMAYMLMYYKGEDQDLIAMMRQFYKEQTFPKERRMSAFTLE